MEIPDVSNVAYGVVVGDSVGISYIDPKKLLDAIGESIETYLG